MRSALSRKAIGSCAIAVAMVGSVVIGTTSAQADPLTIADRTEPLTIAAVGDSYLAGIGAGDYRTDGGCRRSSNSPAAVMAKRLGAELIDRTCPGATLPQTADQLDSLPTDIDAVLASAGGNDIGFSVLAGACLIGGTSTCTSAISLAHRQLPQVRRNVMGVVRQARLQSPSADVIVLGYPQLLASPDSCAVPMSTRSIRAVNRLQRTLDRVIKSAARSAGARFVDWPRAVDKRSLCSTDPWYALPGDRLDDLLHPDERATSTFGRYLSRMWPA